MLLLGIQYVTYFVTQVVSYKDHILVISVYIFTHYFLCERNISMMNDLGTAIFCQLNQLLS